MNFLQGEVQSVCLCLNSCRTRWKKVRKPKNEVVKPSEKDYYKLLGLEQERWLATEDQILKGLNLALSSLSKHLVLQLIARLV